MAMPLSRRNTRARDALRKMGVDCFYQLINTLAGYTGHRARLDYALVRLRPKNNITFNRRKVQHFIFLLQKNTQVSPASAVNSALNTDAFNFVGGVAQPSSIKKR